MCEICGKSSCTRSFHSLDEQNDFDEAIEKATGIIKKKICHKINRMDCANIDGTIWVKLEEVEKIVEDI